MVLAEAIGLDKDKPNRVTKVAVKMLKGMWCLCPCRNDPLPFPSKLWASGYYLHLLHSLLRLSWSWGGIAHPAISP